VQWVSDSLSERNFTFGNNSAECYGQDWASFPHILHTNNLIVYLQQEKLLVVDLVDHFGQIVLTDSCHYAS